MTLPKTQELGEKMKRRLITKLLKIVLCMGTLAVLPIGGFQEQLFAQTSSGNAAFGTSDNFAARTYNFDKDFLNKDTVAPSKSGFRDVLVTPAMMSPLADKTLLNGIAMAGNRVVAVGWQGHIVYSDDKGKSWTQAKVPVSVDLTAVYFPTPKQGWAVGHDGVILHSADGGTTWVKNFDGYAACQAMNKYYKDHGLSGKRDKAAEDKLRDDISFMIDQGPVNPFLGVYFENENSGYVVGAFNLIFHTENGGKTWEPWFDRTDNPMGLHFYAVKTVGKDLYISGEQGIFLKLDRQAKYFKAIKTPYIGSFFDIVGAPGGGGACSCSVCAAMSIIPKIPGATWRKVDIADTSAILSGTVTNDGAIVLVSQGGNVLMSKDHGKSFSVLKREAQYHSPGHAVVVNDNKTAIIVGFLGVQVQGL